MCGIAGIVSNEYDPEDLKHDLKKAVQLLRHRGPDDSGTWLGENVALGHTRLSILDLSFVAHQPMTSEDGRYVIIFNGEIYNFADIRKTLAARGYSFSGTGDTEVILQAFREWGSSAVQHFIGMFAIGLWDRASQTLELLRDRIGVKPLYYAWHRNTLCFASELKALRAFRHWQPTIDRQALGTYFQYGYVPDDRSIYDGVHKLPPGHRLRLERGKSPVVEPYWSVLNALEESTEGDDEELEGQVESLIIDSCRYRMVSDVPVGVFLSGGIDSSLITALLAKHHSSSIRTFTIGFREENHDESGWARQVAEHCGTEHTEYILSATEAIDIAKNWGDMFDEPFGDSSSIPTLLVSRLAARDVKVVLSADGGDELFSGYNAYTTALRRHKFLRNLPGFLTRSSSMVLNALDNLPARYSGRRLNVWNELLQETSPPGLIDAAMSIWLPSEIRSLLGEYESPSIPAYPGSAAVQMGLRDFHHYLPGDILTKVDRTTMLASIEGREPLLDHRLAELAFRLPDHLRRGPLGPKHLLKKILHRYVPRELVHRPKKGFSIPKETWLKADLKEMVFDYLSPQRIRTSGVLDEKQITQLVSDFYAGKSASANRLWSLLAFEMWRARWSQG